MRALALWAVLFAAYAATLGINAVGRSDYGGDEPRYLLVAESIVSDRDIDLTDEFATRAYADFHAGPLGPQGQVILGRSIEPQGIGFAAADRARVRARRGERGRALPRRDRARSASCSPRRSGGGWCRSRGRAARRCSSGCRRSRWRTRPRSTPRPRPATALAGAALCALRVRERPAFGSAVVGAALLAALPWLGPKYLLPAAPIAFALVRWTARRGRRTAALAAAEIMVASHRRLRDDQRPPVRRPDARTPRPRPGRSPTGADSVAEHVERLPRLAALWIDRDVGLLRWAPVLALSVFAAVAAVALAARAPRAAGRGARRRRGGRGARALGLGRRAARRGVRRAVDRRRVVRGPPAGRRAPAGGGAVRLGPAPRAAHRRRARRAHAARLAVARARVRVRRRGRVGRPRDDAPLGPAVELLPRSGSVVVRRVARALGGGARRAGGAASGGGAGARGGAEGDRDRSGRRRGVAGR